MKVPRMRVFAGPNGSGKSTLNTVLPSYLLGVYLNADEIEAALTRQGFVDLACYGLESPLTGVQDFLTASPLFSKSGAGVVSADGLDVDGTRVLLADRLRNSYAAAALAEYVREELLRQGVSFTFETVMSHHSKVDFMRKALAAGFRVYLYYIATSNPNINVARVKSRVQSGGHSVPEDKILSRYGQSLKLLYDAIRNSSRPYIFDNSADTAEIVWIAKCTDGIEIELQVEDVPDWFAQHIIDRFESG